MTALDTAVTITVEGSAKILRGTLVPYGRPALIADRDGAGKLMIYRERWDADSAAIPTELVPLLQTHDDSRPIGKVTRLWSDASGLQLEAELVGSSSEIDGLRERIGHGVLTGLSVGFFSDGTADQWEAASRPGGVPTVLRRRAQVREASLCVWPAYDKARVTALRNRTEQQAASDQLVAEHRERRGRERAEVERIVAERRADKERWHLESERLKAEALARRAEHEPDRHAEPPPPVAVDPIDDPVFQLRIAAAMHDQRTDPGPYPYRSTMLRRSDPLPPALAILADAWAAGDIDKSGGWLAHPPERTPTQFTPPIPPPDWYEEDCERRQRLAEHDDRDTYPDGS
ncbi:MAG TPA: HK97 family phage prohead protease [Acidimicrobiales bacterium]|nr:HK97 family phage prohead protease [Acidimicrobiales bacterium]